MVSMPERHRAMRRGPQAQASIPPEQQMLLRASRGYCRPPGRSSAIACDVQRQQRIARREQMLHTKRLPLYQALSAADDGKAQRRAPVASSSRVFDLHNSSSQLLFFTFLHSQAALIASYQLP